MGSGRRLGIAVSIVLLAVLGCGDSSDESCGSCPTPAVVIQPMDPASAQLTGWHGGNGGGDWADDPLQGARLEGISIWGGSVIDAVQLSWIRPDGSIVWGPRRGGPGGGTATVYPLKVDEYVTKIHGYSGVFDFKFLVTNLCFWTNYSESRGLPAICRGVPVPFGYWEEVPAPGRSFHGMKTRSGTYLDAIQFYSYLPALQ